MAGVLCRMSDEEERRPRETIEREDAETVKVI
jgi:hypothetical protein